MVREAGKTGLGLRQHAQTLDRAGGVRGFEITGS